MKAIYLVILTLIVQTSIFAQSTTELDQKGGFKEFKVGDDISVYKDKAKFTKTLENADTKLFLVKELVSVKKLPAKLSSKFIKIKSRKLS